MVGVSWYEAIAYSRWLTDKVKAGIAATEADEIGRLIANEGWEITLPSESQWEKAARGPDGRTYPWGSEADPERANYVDTGLGTTSAVGCFASGVSPYGVEEMSGNVWEWCRTKWQGSYEGYEDDNGLEGDTHRVLRGGAFYDDPYFVRCAARGNHYPFNWNNSYGFRVMVAPFTSDR